MFFRKRYVVYDDDGKLVIVSHRRDIAINYARSTSCDNRKRPSASTSRRGRVQQT